MYFTCSLINNAVSNSDYTASNNWMIVNNDVERTAKEAVMA
jgi:hypothetical protein